MKQKLGGRMRPDHPIPAFRDNGMRFEGRHAGPLAAAVQALRGKQLTGEALYDAWLKVQTRVGVDPHVQANKSWIVISEEQRQAWEVFALSLTEAHRQEQAARPSELKSLSAQMGGSDVAFDANAV
jgi:hypothetical protein